MNNRSGLSAGFVFIVVLAAGIVIGMLVGHLLGSNVIGGFIGGVVGLFVASLAVYRLYMLPLRKYIEAQDYSHLQPRLDDDD